MNVTRNSLISIIMIIINGKFLVWDAMCTDTCCASNIACTCLEPGRAVAHAESEKIRTCSHLCKSYCFLPVDAETSGVFGPQALAFLKELGRCTRKASGNPRSYAHLTKRISVTIQRGNAIAVSGTMDLDYVPSV